MLGAVRALTVVLVIAFVLRLGAIGGTWDAQPWGDPADYHLHGAVLALAGTYPPTTYAAPGSASALRPPAYPYLLGGVYEVVGVKVNAARLVGALLGTSVVGLVFLVSRRLWDERHALAAAGLVAVFPPLVWLSAALLSEVLFMPLVLGAVLVLLRVRERPSLRGAALAGLLLGLAALTRSNGAILLLPALLAVATVSAGRRRSAALAGVLVAAFALTLVPWTLRNLAALDAVRPLGTQTGYTLAGQWNPDAAKPDAFQAAWRVPPQVPAFKDLFLRPDLDEADVDAQLRERAVDFARDDLGHVAAALRLNALRLFEAGPGHTFVSGIAHREMGIPDGWRWLVRLSTWLLVPFALAGAILLARRRALGPAWLWLVPLLLLAAIVPLLGSPRYRVAADPFLLMLAAAVVVDAGRRLRR